MSRRRARREDPAAGGEAPRGERSPAGRGYGPPGGRPPAAGGHSPRGGSAKGGIARDVAILIAVFAVAAGVAELAGAANLGVAFGVGQVAFAIAIVVLLTRK